MADKPDSNINSGSREPLPGGDHIHIEQISSAVVNIGRGSVTTGPVAQGDMSLYSPVPAPQAPDDHTEFAARMEELRAAIQRAREEGQLSPEMADEALKNLDEAAEAVANGEGAREPLLRSLGFVGDILDTASNLLGPATGAISTAVPVLALLVKVASRLF